MKRYSQKGAITRDAIYRGECPSPTNASGHRPQKGGNMIPISYTRHGDYFLPDIVLSDPPDAPPLGRYGRMHKAHLREHRPILYSQLLLSERLYPLCREIDEAAAHYLSAIPNRAQAEEIINELVYE